MSKTEGKKLPAGFLLPAAALILFWIASVIIVDPSGEFPINDDWRYTQCFKALWFEGRLVPTGWGLGGPALITHLIWAGLFTAIFDFSFTVLRVSVLCAGILTSFLTLFIYRSLGNGWLTAFIGAMTLSVNPLFFSQCFTFMTDVTFAFYLTVSLYLLHKALDRNSMLFFVLGLLTALVATLTRQFGLVLPIGLFGLTLLHPAAGHYGRVKILLLCLLTALAWLGWEHIVTALGGSSLTKHQNYSAITDRIINNSLLGYMGLVLGQIFLVAVPYVAFLISPLLIWQAGPLLHSPRVRRGLLVYAVLFLLFEAAIVSGLIHPPVHWHYNVLVNFGIGPLLFKDSYLLGVPALPRLSAPGFYCLAAWAGLMSAYLLYRLFSSLSSFRRGSLNMTASLALAATIVYYGVLVLTGFHDRHLIPLFIMVSTWLLADPPTAVHSRPKALPALSVALLIVIGIFSVGGTHDFMAVKKAAHEAHNYLLYDLQASPCQVDGGFEFNGYNCLDFDFEPKPGLSWWWVTAENYLVALSKLPDYKEVRRFPFQRYLAADSAVYLLAPD